MNYRMLSPLLIAVALVGCEMMPTAHIEAPNANSELPTECNEEIPTLVESTCLVDAWVAFGLASQRGNREWRDEMLERVDSPTAQARLNRAVLLAWGTERQWNQAAELLREDIHAAPSDLQPLLRYWLNEVEGRRGMSERLERSESQRRAASEENAALSEKLEALTDIEQSINLRQLSP
ncbi:MULTISPECIES: hypothetical protein [Halomonadaceae]|uniref:hypothetical protein n=1 Tax=Halomonadaceae TaxID=28256 RepID=UPI00159AF930|nr:MULTISPECIES: hypothetical protein [Halomonas]QJQ95149.1 hypothetical protein HIO72_07595 [Halomonas sp. PA5]